MKLLARMFSRLSLPISHSVDRAGGQCCHAYNAKGITMAAEGEVFVTPCKGVIRTRRVMWLVQHYDFVA